MDSKRFKFWNRICALAAFLISAVTYLLTIEPSASFWDCGEFIASSYKLEVGHPPGNPVFQLIARLFTMLGDNMHAAILVNAMSALCSALTIFFLYLTIVWFAKRMVKPREDGTRTAASAIAIFGSGLVGALAYTFSDTFWFSAVEGEVYAMSSLFTAVVFWAMTRWYEQADQPHANRWIVLIAFLMGLSIGVHLLNLLAIPAIVFMYFYRQREDCGYTFWQYAGIFLLGVVILGFLTFIFIPVLPKLAAYVDLAFVNWFGCPYNLGAAVFMVLVIGLCFLGLFATMKKGKALLNTVLLCTTMILIGFSAFSIDIIRSCAKTPTNEYQPDNAFTLVRYLSREQYGSTPLLYGQYYDAPYDIKMTKYWAPLDGKYLNVDGPIDAEYRAEGKMLFPRMWSSSPDGRAEEFYQAYTGGKGTRIRGRTYPKPSMGANLLYFFDYQLNWMYWRYFMWNFVGRQNEIHSPSPGNIFYGNWESGIGFIDSVRLGDQSDAPDVLKCNKGKNHYFFLPLLLGLLGLFYQFSKDKRGCWLTFLMFFMTGIAIVIFLNQPPFQVRERDYAYAGSFYFFSVWIGLAVAALAGIIDEARNGRSSAALNAAATAACLCVPALMAAQNWDDHDRSNRATAVEMARNYLNSVGENGILVTHGDNDTFPLWYAQEVEDVRTDVRICNTSLLGTDWHIDQMKWACNKSAPLDLSLGPKDYLYGTNEYIPIYDETGDAMPLKEVIASFADPVNRLPMSSGKTSQYICARNLILPVDKENVIRSGIMDAKYAEMIPDSIALRIPKDKDYLTKPELFMLDLLSSYRWDRPLCFLNMGGDLNVGIKDYMEYLGFSYMLIPVRNRPNNVDLGFVDTDELYRRMTGVYCWDAISRDDYFIDYQNLYTFLGTMSQRNLFVSAANSFIKAGENDRASEMLARCEEVMHRYPVECVPLGFSGNDYMMIQMMHCHYMLGEKEKARAIGSALAEELLNSAGFYLQFHDIAYDDFSMVGTYAGYLAEYLIKGDDRDMASDFLARYRTQLSESVPLVAELYSRKEVSAARILALSLSEQLMDLASISAGEKLHDIDLAHGCLDDFSEIIEVVMRVKDKKLLEQFQSQYPELFEEMEQS